ncbi:DUF6922 domain-containing protein [Pedobacter miscanthi]|uniref:DUF6922 domain-containing protein n=1 Tax=Pedobacter miscanthi TaxID=2259170 RepID=UPI0039775C65
MTNNTLYRIYFWRDGVTLKRFIQVPFENDEIKIERQPLIQKVRRPDLPKVLFWDFDFDKLDWNRSYKTVIERVLDKGNTMDSLL